jgi:enoyl-CoA hydratase
MTELEYDVTDGVAVITLAAPERKNALTPEMARNLAAAVDRADANEDVGAIVVTGGPSFCAGADLSTLGNVESDPLSEANVAAIEAIYAAFLRLGAAKAPSVAAVRGAAVGAGLNLALATDVRIVARDARLMSGFGRIGLHPGGGHFALVARLAGPEAAAALGIFGAEINGARAVEIGLAWAAEADADVERTALELARRVAADPQLARAMHASLRQEAGPPGVPWHVAVEVERARQLWSFRRKAAAPS